MSEEIDARGRWILSHAICRWCGRPSWDHFPDGVVADRYRCGFCGMAQNDPGGPVYTSGVGSERNQRHWVRGPIEEDAREVTA